METNLTEQELWRRDPSRHDVARYAQPLFAGDLAERDLNTDAPSGGLLDYWYMVKKRRGTVIRWAIAGIALALLVTLPRQTMYRATTTLEIQNVNTDFLNAKQIDPVSEDSPVNLLTDMQTQVKIIQSEALIDRVIDKLNGDGKLGSFPRETPAWSLVHKFFRLGPAAPADIDYNMRQRAMQNLSVQQVGQTRLVEISFTASDPGLAAEFANEAGSEYIESNIKARWKMNEHTSEWLSRQLDVMRKNLQRSEDALEAYARDAGLLFTTSSGGADKVNVAEDKLRQLQEELSKAQATRAEAQSRYDVARTESPDSLGDVISDDPLRALEAKLTDLRREKADLIVTYTDKHEKVRRIDAQIAPLQAEFNQERANIVKHIRNEYNAALGREKLLLAAYAAQARIVTDQAGKTIQYGILKREADSNRQLYESTLQQVKEASVASAIRASNIRIVDPAKTPRKPYSPSYAVASAGGLAAGALLGLVIVIFRERTDRTLQEPGHSQFWTKAPELGAIPALNPRTARGLDRGNSFPGIAAGNDESRPKLRRIRPHSAGPMIWRDAPSSISEAFRNVSMSLLHLGEEGSAPRVLVVTSASQLDGKTTIVSNLGSALAEIGQSVLIIDADLRQPRLHKIIGLPNDRGLSTLLKDSHIHDRSDIGAQPSTIQGLDVLTSGPAANGDFKLLYSPRLSTVLANAKSKYDVVLVDTPPSLEIADARMIARLTDGVVLVARAGRTTRQAAIAMNQRFAEDRIRIVGTILNDWNPRNAPSGYYGYLEGPSFSEHDQRLCGRGCS